MTTRRCYLDHNATTPLHPSAREAMLEAFDLAGNPSSIHAEGRAARAVIDAARRDVAALVGARAENVYFTSGGTEALNLVLTPEMASSGRRFARLLMGAGEHAAVLNGHRFGAAAEVVAWRRDGRLDLDALQRRIGGEPVMLALQAANNETGVIQPVREAADLVHAAGGFVVCDAVQGAGKVACDMSLLGADALVVSAHKFGGPKGVGALCFAGDNHHMEQGLVRGGGQERGLRAGTENLPGIAGMGAAARLAASGRDGHARRLAAWRDALEAELFAAAPDAVVFGASAERLPNTTCFALPRFDGQTVLMSLDLGGVAVSAGSACAAGRPKPSRVIGAMGVDDDLAARALRVSLGWSTTEDDIAHFARALGKTVATVRPRRAA